MRNLIFIAALLTAAMPAQSVDNPPVQSHATSAFAKSALVGMQLSVSNGLRQGKISAAAAQCVQSLDDSSFNDTFQSLLSTTLSTTELQTAEAFFSSPAGKKYAKHGLMQLYMAVGEKPPEPLPIFSDAEYKELENFSHTAAGEKLIDRKVLDSASAKSAIVLRIQSLLRSCNGKPQGS